jgi:hypothetical protein
MIIDKIYIEKLDAYNKNGRWFHLIVLTKMNLCLHYKKRFLEIKNLSFPGQLGR